MNLAVFGASEIQRQLTTGLAQMSNRIDREIQYAGIACQKYAKQLCPVDTGRLRSSIQYVNTGFQQCIVDTDVYYGIFVELGTSRQAPQPFMQPAYEDAKAELIQNLKALRL